MNSDEYQDWLAEFYPADQDEADVFFSIMFKNLENSYILGRITKQQMVDCLTKLYGEDSNLDIVEAMEEIDRAKERFYDDMIERTIRALRERDNDGI